MWHQISHEFTEYYVVANELCGNSKTCRSWFHKLENTDNIDILKEDISK